MLEQVPCADITRLGLSADGTDIQPLAGLGIQFHTRSQNPVPSGWLRLKKEKKNHFFLLQLDLTSHLTLNICYVRVGIVKYQEV